MHKSHRCLIPYSGWDENGQKQKYLFSNSRRKTLVININRCTNKIFAEYIKRMPIIFLLQNVEYWFQSPVEQVAPVFESIGETMVDIKAA